MDTLFSLAHIAGDALTVFAEVSVPDPAPKLPPGMEKIEDIIGWAKWLALAVCILGLIAAGGLMAIQSRRGEGGEHAGKIGMALGGVIVISAAASLVGFIVN